MNIDDRDRAGRTPLHYAAIDPPHDLPHIAAQTDAKLKAENDRKANEYKVVNTTKLLEAGAEVNAADDNGSTPLHFAATGDSVDVVKLLLDAGADINAANAKGETPLLNATLNTTPAALAIATLLLGKGADPHAEASDGFSPLLFVKRYGKPEFKELFSGLLG